jgi:hypothetical protein
MQHRMQHACIDAITLPSTALLTEQSVLRISTPTAAPSVLLVALTKPTAATGEMQGTAAQVLLILLIAPSHTPTLCQFHPICRLQRSRLAAAVLQCLQQQRQHHGSHRAC